MILPDWALTAVTGLIGALLALVSRQALARMGEYHREAMVRLDRLTQCLEMVRATMAEHMRDHASGMFNHRKRTD